MLSEELQTQMEQQAAQEDPAAVPKAAELKPAAPVWAGAIRYAGLAVGVAALLAALWVVLPWAEPLAFLWMLASPVVVVGLFHGKYPMARITAGFGARVGLIVGLGISVVMLAGNALKLLLVRHAQAADPISVLVSQMVAQMKQQPNAMQDPSMLHYIDKLNTVPEYRAGFLLGILAMMVGMLLVATTAAGAFAGFARSRQQR